MDGAYRERPKILAHTLNGEVPRLLATVFIRAAHDELAREDQISTD